MTITLLRYVLSSMLRSILVRTQAFEFFIFLLILVNQALVVFSLFFAFWIFSSI